MNLNLLHLDHALTQQTDFMAQCHDAGAVEMDAVATGAKIRLWAMDDALAPFEQFLKERLTKKQGVPVTFLGSGDFHHVTGLLLPAILERSEIPVTVIHFDNHPDWVAFDDGMHCGSWVNRALALPQVDRVITVGVCSKDLNVPECKGANLSALKEGKIILYPFAHKPSVVCGDYGSGASYTQRGRKIHWRTVHDMGRDELLSELLAHIRTARIYITLDKDVLDRSDAITNWDQGAMRLDDVMWLIRGLAAQRGIAGIDVTGDYSKPHYEGTWNTTFKKRIEIAIDQAWAVPNMDMAIHRNSQSNCALLAMFKEVAS